MIFVPGESFSWHGHHEPNTSLSKLKRVKRVQLHGAPHSEVGAGGRGSCSFERYLAFHPSMSYLVLFLLSFFFSSLLISYSFILFD
jgi:hypothetical protein